MEKTSALATASPSSQATSPAEGAPELEGEENRPQPSAPPAMRSRAPSPPGPQGASPYHRCAPPPDWAYSQEGINMAKCERCHERFRHSTTACRNCQQRSACFSCIRQLKHGDPAYNRCRFTCSSRHQESDRSCRRDVSGREMEGDSPTTINYSSALRHPDGHGQTTEEEEETNATSLSSPAAAT